MVTKEEEILALADRAIENNVTAYSPEEIVDLMDYLNVPAVSQKQRNFFNKAKEVALKEIEDNLSSVEHSKHISKKAISKITHELVNRIYYVHAFPNPRLTIQRLMDVTGYSIRTIRHYFNELSKYYDWANEYAVTARKMERERYGA